MAIGYVITKKLIHLGLNPGLKFIARIFREKPVTQDKIAKEIADQSSLSVGDVYNVFQCLKERIASHLAEGKTVKIELLGTFYTSIKAIAQNERDDVKSTTIENVNVRFLPSKELIAIVRAAGLKYINTEIKGIQYREFSGKKSNDIDFNPNFEDFDPESENFDQDSKNIETSPEKNELKSKK